jgi:catechol 2,3-dioxygenase-like lactoylglutathione lyase family enzyme
MDDVLIVVDDLEAAKAFFLELGLELEGETTVEGPSVDRLLGLQGVRATLAELERCWPPWMFLAASRPEAITGRRGWWRRGGSI